jgi:hypothetical protein
MSIKGCKHEWLAHENDHQGLLKAISNKSVEDDNKSHQPVS